MDVGVDAWGFRPRGRHRSKRMLGAVTLYRQEEAHLCVRRQRQSGLKAGNGWRSKRPHFGPVSL